MRIAITGATGFLGRDLTARLLAGGHQLVCTRHRNASVDFVADPSVVEWVEGSFVEEAVCARLVRGCDFLVHAARHGARAARGESPIPYLEHNVLGGLRLFDTARKAGVKRIIYLSTSAVGGISMDEATISRRTMGLYPLMKATMEMLTNYVSCQSKVEICSLRPSAILGLAPDRSSVAIYNWTRQIIAGKPLQLQDVHRGWVHVEDVSRAILFLLNQPDIGGKHLDCFDPGLPSDPDIAGMIARIAGVRATHVVDAAEYLPCRRPEALLQRGFAFGGLRKLEDTLRQFVHELQSELGPKIDISP